MGKSTNLWTDQKASMRYYKVVRHHLCQTLSQAVASFGASVLFGPKASKAPSDIKPMSWVAVTTFWELDQVDKTWKNLGRTDGFFDI